MRRFVQCDLVVPDERTSKLANFPPIFKKTMAGRNDIGDYMKNNAIENEMLKHCQRMLISSFKLGNCTVISPLFNFYLELGLQCTKSTVLFSILHKNVSKISFNQWLMREEREMKTICQEL